MNAAPSHAVARVRKSAAPRAVMNPTRTANAKPAAFRTLHQDDDHEDERDERLENEQEGEHETRFRMGFCGT
jgi:hypothetical protein